MARQYTQTTRISKSYSSYLKNIENISKKGYATIAPLEYQKYSKIYIERSSKGLPNIAREVARNYNVVTTATEAKTIERKVRQHVKDLFATNGLNFTEANAEAVGFELLSKEEIEALSGVELWEYLKEVGYSDREAGKIYDGKR